MDIKDLKSFLTVYHENSINQAAKWYEGRLERLQVPVHLGTEVGKEDVLTGARVTGFHDGILTVQCGEEGKSIPCDSVILAVGYKEDSLYHELEFDVPQSKICGFFHVKERLRKVLILFYVWFWYNRL